MNALSPSTQRAMKARGYRNKNPGNIDYMPANRWQGQVGLGDSWLPQRERRFAEFTSHVYGIRALAMLLITYQDRHGLRTIRQIINRWAPPTENRTSSYVSFVDQQLPRHTADDPLNLHNYQDLREMVVAIITHELGGMPYDDATIDEGLRLAGVPRPVTTLADAAATNTGKSALQMGGFVTAVTFITELVRSVQELPPLTGVAVVIACVLAFGLYILNQRKKKAEPDTVEAFKDPELPNLSGEMPL